MRCARVDVAGDNVVTFVVFALAARCRRNRRPHHCHPRAKDSGQSPSDVVRPFLCFGGWNQSGIGVCLLPAAGLRLLGSTPRRSCHWGAETLIAQPHKVHTRVAMPRSAVGVGERDEHQPVAHLAARLPCCSLSPYQPL